MKKADLDDRIQLAKEIKSEKINLANLTEASMWAMKLALLSLSEAVIYLAEERDK